MNSKTISRLAAVVALVGGAALLGAPGCGPSASSLCNKTCDCEGCSDSELDECIDTVEDLGKLADDEGCGDRYDDYLGCVNSEFECRDGDSDVDGCESEFTELGKCIN